MDEEEPHHCRPLMIQRADVRSASLEEQIAALDIRVLVTEAESCLRDCPVRSKRRSDLGKSEGDLQMEREQLPGQPVPLAPVGSEKARNWARPQLLDLFNSFLVFLGSTPGEYGENGLAIPLSDLAGPRSAQ